MPEPKVRESSNPIAVLFGLVLLVIGCAAGNSFYRDLKSREKQSKKTRRTKARSTVTKAANVGDTQLTVAKLDNFRVGATISIGGVETRKILSVDDVITLESALQTAVAVGIEIEKILPRQATQLIEAATAGDTVLKVASAKGFSPGDVICIGEDEVQTVAPSEAEGTLGLVSPLSKDFVVGVPVVSKTPGSVVEDDDEELVSHQSDEEELTTEDLSEDAYGLAITSICHDLHHIQRDEGSLHDGLRKWRVATSIGLVVLNMAVQLFLLSCITNYACSTAVYSIRNVYDKYEQHMYEGHVFKTKNGFARGLSDAYFKKENFATLDDDTKDLVCKIPFSQPAFLFIILFVWTILVAGEMSECVLLFDRLILNTPTAPNMKRAVVRQGEDEVIVSVTSGLKIFFTVVLFIPRLLMAVFLLWIGCRWLSATTDYENLVLNGVGLEFVLLLKELFYKALVPGRSKRDVRRTKINIAYEAGDPSPVSYLGTFVWGVASCAWVWLYIYGFQAVLPYYQFDVHEACEDEMQVYYNSLT